MALTPIQRRKLLFADFVVRVVLDLEASAPPVAHAKVRDEARALVGFIETNDGRRKTSSKRKTRTKS